MDVSNLPFTQIREERWFSPLLSAWGAAVQVITGQVNSFHLLESPLTVLALIPDPSVVTHAGPVHALPRITALIAGLGHGGAFRVEHEVQHHKHSQVRSQRVPGAPPGRPGPAAQVDIIHDGTRRACVSEEHRLFSFFFFFTLWGGVQSSAGSQVAYLYLRRGRRKTVITRRQNMPSGAVRCGGSCGTGQRHETFMEKQKKTQNKTNTSDFRTLKSNQTLKKHREACFDKSSEISSSRAGRGSDVNTRPWPDDPASPTDAVIPGMKWSRWRRQRAALLPDAAERNTSSVPVLVSGDATAAASLSPRSAAPPLCSVRPQLLSDGGKLLHKAPSMSSAATRLKGQFPLKNVKAMQHGQRAETKTETTDLTSAQESHTKLQGWK